MKKLLAICLLVILYSCNDTTTNKPKNLLTKDQLAEIIADFAIYDQVYIIGQNTNLEETHLFVLKKHNIKAEDFKDSYTYYAYNPDNLQEIYDKAKEKIIEKDPKAKEYIEKKKNPQTAVPTEK